MWSWVLPLLLGCSDTNSTLAERGQGEIQNRWGLQSASSLQSVRLQVWDEQNVGLVGNGAERFFEDFSVKAFSDDL